MTSFAGQYEPLVGRESRARLSLSSLPAPPERWSGDGQRRTDVTQDQGDKLLGAAVTHAECFGHPHCQKNLLV
jgi:hypothetical protein